MCHSHRTPLPWTRLCSGPHSRRSLLLHLWTRLFRNSRHRQTLFPNTSLCLFCSLVPCLLHTFPHFRIYMHSLHHLIVSLWNFHSTYLCLYDFCICIFLIIFHLAIPLRSGIMECQFYPWLCSLLWEFLKLWNYLSPLSLPLQKNLNSCRKPQSTPADHSHWPVYAILLIFLF